MSDEDAILRAIDAAPADPTPKLVYADWLDDRGHPDRAAYVRLLADSYADDRPFQRFWQLRYLHTRWADQLGGAGPPADAATVSALGRLNGLLETYAHLNGQEVDVWYEFAAGLQPRTGPVGWMASAWYSPGLAPVTLAPLPDWEAVLRAALREWLFYDLQNLRDRARPFPTRLALLTADGRDGLVDQAVRRIREVIEPTAGWTVQVTPGEQYPNDALALEAADRVLWLHFSFSN